MFVPGDGFWPSRCDGHLHFIISDSIHFPDEVLIVNITSYNPVVPHTETTNDPACIIEPGEHSFITKPSCVYYAGAQITTVGKLEYREKTGELRRHSERASEALLDRMRQCAGDSMHMEPRDFEVLVRQQVAA